MTKLLNIWLLIKAYWRHYYWYYVPYWNIETPTGKEDVVPKNYKQTNISFHKGFNWGEYHPDNLDQYWEQKPDVSDVTRHGIEELYFLKAVYEPKTFLIKDKPVPIPYKIDVIESNQTFKYGFFTCEIDFGEGPGQWPAFWLYNGADSYSEIDIVETYSRKGDYFKNKAYQPNIHYMRKGEPWVNMGAVNVPLRKNSFIRFSMHWTEDFIKFYYNGYLVKVVTDRRYLDSMQDMFLVLNLGIEKKYLPDNTSHMAIDNLRVYQEIKNT
jgi:hypothetical protein